MRRTTAFIIIGLLFGTTETMAAPAKAPVTTEEFVVRCKSDAAFCKTQIMAAEVLLERGSKACLPGSVSKDAMVERVRDVVEVIMEEDNDMFRSVPLLAVVGYIIIFLWPCTHI